MGADLSVPVLWVEAGVQVAGRLDLGDDRVHLDGGHGELRRTRDIAAGEISSVRIGRSNGDRVAGRPAIHLVLTGGEMLSLAGLDRPGTLLELAHRLEALI